MQGQKILKNGIFPDDVKSLRVVDASIFPDTISVATNVTTIAVAERISDIIVKSKQ